MRELVEEANLRLFVEIVEDYRPENTFVQQLPEPGTSVPAGTGFRRWPSRVATTPTRARSTRPTASSSGR